MTHTAPAWHPDPQPCGDYGVDAPYVPAMLGVGGGLLLVLAGFFAARGSGAGGAVPCALSGIWLLLSAASYLYTTRIGKFRVWARLLGELPLRGDETILDIGSGRGAVQLMAAKRVPDGEVIGIDLWKSADQSGNTRETAIRNAEREGVAARVAFETGDMRDLPFPDNHFDAVLSSLAIHNITDEAGRARAITEAYRVLKPGGHLLIADIRASREYRDRLRALGAANVTMRTLGWRFWYGGPWVATTLVAATKAA
jgi:arsenite methyltransferase